MKILATILTAFILLCLYIYYILYSGFAALTYQIEQHYILNKTCPEELNTIRVDLEPNVLKRGLNYDYLYTLDLNNRSFCYLQVDNEDLILNSVFTNYFRCNPDEGCYEEVGD